MNTVDAAYAVAHEYGGGCESLGPRMGISGALLRNKVNVNRTPDNRNVLSLAEAVRMTDMTEDDRILEAWANERGYVLVKMIEVDQCSDSAVVELMAQVWETNGEIGKEVSRTFEDGRVESHEVAKIKDRIFAHMSTLFGLFGRIKGMVDDK